MKKSLILFVLLLFFILSGNSFPQQEVYIRITEGMPAIPLALPQFIAKDQSPETASAAKILHEVVAADVKYSRVFNPLPASYYSYIRPLNPNNIFYKDWESIGAKLLVVGEVSAGEEGNFLFESKVYDVKTEKFIFGRRYQSEKSLLRLAAHKLSDELMKILGESPIFTSKIVFISNRDGNDELYMMDYDGYNQTRLTFNHITDYMPAWSADGTKIAYTSYREETAGLYILDISAGERTVVQLEGTNFGAAFSPDGKKLSFCSAIEKGNSEIYVSDSSGKNIKKVTFNKAADTAPTWSPNSREIAFTSDRLGSPQIFIMDAEGSNVRRVSFGGNYFDGPDWAPTGDRIVYVSRVALVFDLYVLNLRTNQAIKLTEGYARNESPTWSPDGRHIIFSSNRTGTIQLYSVDYDGANLKRLTSDGENKLPDWSK